MTTTQPAGNCAHQPRNLSRASARAAPTRPFASTPCTWITRLARSTPTRTASARAVVVVSRCEAPRVICFMNFPFHKLEIDDFEHHQSWRFVAVAGMWEVPSHSQADSQRATPFACRLCQTLGVTKLKFRRSCSHGTHAKCLFFLPISDVWSLFMAQVCSH